MPALLIAPALARHASERARTVDRFLAPALAPRLDPPLAPALRLTAAISVLAALRLLPARALTFLPPCPIHHLTGLLCPGCGGTRALLALLHGDLPAAWHLNPLLLVLSPLLLACTIQPIRHGTAPRLPVPLTSALLLLALTFTIARNL